MWIVTITIDENEVFRASQILSDLRNTAETLFNPLLTMGFWDKQDEGKHLCPAPMNPETCSLHLSCMREGLSAYRQVMIAEYNTSLEVIFAHCKLHLFMR
tara:strand:- start:464 stop:763 length:300 start_codon:yes stop_codon:yes gene_type:complete